MKNRHFLYNLKKAGIVFILIAVMLCTAIKKTSALDTASEDAIATVSDESAEDDSNIIADTTPGASDETVALEVPGGAESGSSTTDDSQAADISTDGSTSDDTGSENSQNTEDDSSSEADIPSDGTDTDAPDTDPSDTDTYISDTNPSDTDTSDTEPSDADTPDSDIPDTDPSGTDTPDTNDNAGSQTPANPQTPANGSQSQANTSAQPEVSTSPNATIQDKSSGAIYIRPTYNPSETFIDLEDRIKYNVALPIDNIPSFITQEMIIGALKCQDETGFTASVTIAQIIQESGFGKYGPNGEDRMGLSYLAYNYCNLFGIKGVGTAGSVNMLTGEQKASGEYYSITAGFRVYNTYTECIEDRTKLLQEVYSDLIEGVTDANTFAMRIGSRWATSLQYSQHLIELMERYDLYRLDRMTLLDFSNMIGRFANPCPGSYLTSSFGYRDFDRKFHKGIDLGTNGSEIPVYAAESGTIVHAEYDGAAGNWVMIDHGDGLVTKYMHFSHTFVKEGEQVTKGQQIGLTGTTGHSTGIHLHFQVEENGVAVDPTPYLTNIGNSIGESTEG